MKRQHCRTLQRTPHKHRVREKLLLSSEIVEYYVSVLQMSSMTNIILSETDNAVRVLHYTIYIRISAFSVPDSVLIDCEFCV